MTTAVAHPASHRARSRAETRRARAVAAIDRARGVVASIAVARAHRREAWAPDGARALPPVRPAPALLQLGTEGT